MSKNKTLSYILGFLLVSSGNFDVTHGMDNKTAQSNGSTFRAQLEPYHLMIASKYFEEIDDFINLTFATKKARCNMERFHFNPISLDGWSRQFFTSLETLHLYDREDKKFEEEKFFKRIIWYDVEYNDDLEKNKEDVVYKKNVILTKEYREQTGMTTVPDMVTEISKDCFWNCTNLKEISLPDSVTRLGQSAFILCSSLTSIGLPTGVKGIPAYCFAFCGSLQEIEIPTSVTYIGDYAFDECSSLTKLVIRNEDGSTKDVSIEQTYDPTQQIKDALMTYRSN